MTLLWSELSDIIICYKLVHQLPSSAGAARVISLLGLVTIKIFLLVNI